MTDKLGFKKCYNYIYLIINYEKNVYFVGLHEPATVNFLYICEKKVICGPKWPRHTSGQNQLPEPTVTFCSTKIANIHIKIQLLNSDYNTRLCLVSKPP